MKHLRAASSFLRFLFSSLVFLSIAVGVSFAGATGSGKNLIGSDPHTRSGFEHFHSLEYDKSIADFEKALQAHPDDPFAVNHLLAALIFRELYRYDALDTTLYASKGNGFLDNKVVLPLDPKVKSRIEQLSGRAIELANDRLRANPNDVEALFARGITRGLRSTYMAMAQKAWFAALRNAIGARRDHERVLELDPDYVDAKTVVGAHNYVVGSLPLPVKVIAGIGGISGNRDRGIKYLYQAARAGGESSVDAKIALGLFLRREARYEEALEVVHGLYAQHPRNFLFGLEAANLLKDAGQGSAAIAAYRQLLAKARKGEFHAPHLQLAYFGLAECLRGQHDYQDAWRAYEDCNAAATSQTEVKRRCLLNSGEMLDLLQKRDEAKKKYEAVIAADPSSAQADIARKHLHNPFRAD